MGAEPPNPKGERELSRRITACFEGGGIGAEPPMQRPQARWEGTWAAWGGEGPAAAVCWAGDEPGRRLVADEVCGAHIGTLAPREPGSQGGQGRVLSSVGRRSGGPRSRCSRPSPRPSPPLAPRPCQRPSSPHPRTSRRHLLTAAPASVPLAPPQQRLSTEAAAAAIFRPPP